MKLRFVRFLRRLASRVEGAPAQTTTITEGPFGISPDALQWIQEDIRQTTRFMELSVQHGFRVFIEAGWLQYLHRKLQIDRSILWIRRQNGTARYVCGAKYGPEILTDYEQEPVRSDDVNESFPMECLHGKDDYVATPQPGIGWDLHLVIRSDSDEVVGILSLDDTSRSRDFTEIEKKALSEIVTSLGRQIRAKQLQESKMFVDRFGAKNAAWLKDYIKTAEYRHKLVGWVAIDLNYLKLINDHCGHAVGDLVLQGLTDLLHEEIRETDHVVHKSGDEFVVLMLGARNEDAQARIDDICRSFTASRFPFPCSKRVGLEEALLERYHNGENTGLEILAEDGICYLHGCSFSFGVSNPRKEDDPDELRPQDEIEEEADNLMYLHKKQSGRRR